MDMLKTKKAVLNAQSKFDEISDEQFKINQHFNQIRKSEYLLPIKVTEFFQKKIDLEKSFLKHTKGPLHRMIYPSQERLHIRAPGEVADFVDDRDNMPEGIPDTVIRKYDNRALFLPTSTCAAHCQYCFRQDVLSEQHETKDHAIDYKLKLLSDYLKDKPAITEVILSGGDPMTLPFNHLEKIIH
jgi:lysine 2,3-aminomutase